MNVFSNMRNSRDTVVERRVLRLSFSVNNMEPESYKQLS